jgi:phosphoglycerate dehydrogenase-like enzyme
VKLIIKKIDDDGRLSMVPGYLDTPWDIQVADSDEPAAFARALAEADALVSMSWRGEVPPTPKLRLLQLPGAGTDDIDFTRVAPLTTVCNCFGHEIGIAEYAMAAMLEWTVKLQAMDAALRAGNWTGSYLCGPRHAELHGKTLGLIGYGRIARETARRADAFGMHLVACSRSERQNEPLIGTVAGMDALPRLFAESDFIVVTAPLTEHTRGLIDARAFERMKPGVFIVNVARGAIIDEDALYDALRTHRIGGAAIDVWYVYPQQGERTAQPSRYPFAELDNVIMTPHASAWTDGLLPRRNRAIAENLNRLARGEPLLNVVHAARAS